MMPTKAATKEDGLLHRVRPAVLLRGFAITRWGLDEQCQAGRWTADTDTRGGVG